MESTAVTTAESKSNTQTKPVKLRSACNSCFSAKVRCDGNKQGCHRCTEKHLDCVFSESMVGKVVGKRRKRPLPDETSNASNNTGSIPSPASTNNSEGPTTKRTCTESSWTSFISYDDQALGDTVDCDDQLYSLDMSNAAFSMTNELPFLHNNGLLTPALSPPIMRYLSPAELETRPCSSNAFSAFEVPQFIPPQLPASASRTPEPQNDDEETVCIKLLAHLKKHNAGERRHPQSQLGLIKKTNAAVRRLLKSKTVRSDYVCQLLLSSIIAHLVTLCEKTCQKRAVATLDTSEHEFMINDEYLEPRADAQFHPESKEAVKAAVKETTVLCSSVGDLLKRRPLNGFQTLGRHETLHVELDQRLKQALSLLV